MNKVMKALAIVALLITVAGAGAVLYGIRMMAPQVQQVSVSATPARDAQEIFDGVLDSVQNETFTGRVFGDPEGLQAEDCTFVTYTVRMANRGFFPAEWIELTATPRAEGEGRDILQMPEDGGRVLTAGGVGDLSATLLVSGNAQDTRRTLELTCYVFGQKIALPIDTN